MNFFDDIERYWDTPALITERDETISYRSLVASADALAQHLTRRSLVFLVCENGVPSLTAYLACLRARAVPLLIGTGTSPEVMAGLLAAYQPEFVWAPEAQADITLGVVASRVGEFVLLATPAAAGRTPLHKDLALLLTTSGSTGSPMLVRLSYENIVSNAVAIAEYLTIASTDRPITSLPMNYTFGLSIINSHLLRGCTIIVSNKSILDKGFWAALRTHAATTLGGVPYTYEMLRKLGFARLPLQTIKTLTQAGGKLSAELAREFAAGCEARGIRFVVMYGQAEATARMSYLPAEFAVSKAGSIGVAIPGGELWLEDDAGSVVTEAEHEGELHFRGPNVSLGYAASRADLGRGDDNGGQLRTGDLARRDADGFFYITGRKKRFLKLFGNRVNLDDVERILEQAGHAGACAGVDDHLRVFVVGADDGAAVRTLLATRLGVHPTAIEVRAIDGIPRNASGKILYSALPS